MKYFEKVKKQVIGSLKKIILTNGKFSLTFEYTSVKNRRYMNLNIHYNGGFQSLEMLRVNGTMPASKAIELITKKLDSFGLNLDKDIVASVTDGASLMKKIGYDTKPVTICYCNYNAIHLCVIDVLFRN